MRLIKTKYASLEVPTGKGWRIGSQGDAGFTVERVRELGDKHEAVVRIFVTAHVEQVEGFGLPKNDVTTITPGPERFGGDSLEVHSISKDGYSRREGWSVEREGYFVTALCILTRHATRRDIQRMHECFDSIKLRNQAKVEA